jgi:alkylation response protein AidB-like acyl-CoA dehydrogenase
MRLQLSPELEAFREEMRTFFTTQVPQEIRDTVAAHRNVSKEQYVETQRVLNAAGLAVPHWPVEWGGQDWTPLQRHLWSEEMTLAHVPHPIVFNTAMVGPVIATFGSEELKQRFLPKTASAEIWWSQGFSEPNAGSDLASLKTSAVRDGDDYIVNGQKTFITNGIHSDLVIVVVKTDPEAKAAYGLSLLVVERGMPGFERGRNLDKIGLKAQDTAELFFTDVRVPATNLLGEPNRGFFHLMDNLPQERLAIAVGAAAACERVLDETLEYCKTRTAFGRPIGSFQHSRFVLAELATEVQIARVFVDKCIVELNAGRLSVPDAAMAKWWTTELQLRVVDAGVQLHGGYGYMLEYPIAQAYLDSRVQTIYGGTTEIMKEIIGRSLGV